jgi:hypothetical protein
MICIAIRCLVRALEQFEANSIDQIDSQHVLLSLLLQLGHQLWWCLCSCVTNLYAMLALLQAMVYFYGSNGRNNKALWLVFMVRVLDATTAFVLLFSSWCILPSLNRTLLYCMWIMWSLAWKLLGIAVWVVFKMVYIYTTAVANALLPFVVIALLGGLGSILCTLSRMVRCYFFKPMIGLAWLVVPQVCQFARHSCVLAICIGRTISLHTTRHLIAVATTKRATESSNGQVLSIRYH